MAKSDNLRALLETLVPSGNVYYQPPESLKLSCPCIIFGREALDTKFANDKPYSIYTKFKITVVDRDPDSPIVLAVAALPSCKFSRRYTANNLYHDGFNIYF